MAKKYEISGHLVEYIPDHLGGTAVQPAGGTVTVALPTGTGVVYMRASGGAAYYNVNAAANGTVTPGYVPQDGGDFVFHCDNLSSLSVYAVAGVTVHTQFYSS